MGIGVGIFLFAVGAILAFAVNVTTSAVNLETVGVILMLVGGKLQGFGRTAISLAACADYRRGYLCGMVRGDANLKVYRYQRPGRTRADVHRFRLALADVEGLQRTHDYLLHEGISTDWFDFTPATDARRAVTAIRTSKAHSVARIMELVAWPPHPTEAWRRGFLAGIFDAEGARSHGILRISNSDDGILSRAQAALVHFGFDSLVEDPGLANGVKTIRVRGGLREHIRFAHLVDPAIRRKCSVEGTAVKSDADLRVVSVEPLGLEMPMYDITTGTGDFIANGVISHNCFARRTHEWLELDTGHDFDSQIVVKTNLVDVLRKELARPSWQREHVALGTNTDPYQRAEGRYKLMPGVIRALTDSGTPFSILTKGTLLRRDIPLLVESAQTVPVGLGVSMAIWDDDLHAALEPGVPTPRARLDLVRAITDAGLPCGVFLAPVLPGLTDGVADLDAALAAIAAAGATGVTVIPLHLRPGAREWFMAWLSARPPRAGAALRAALRPPRLRAGRVPHLAGAAGGAAAREARPRPAEGRRGAADRSGRRRCPGRRGGRLPGGEPALRRAPGGRPAGRDGEIAGAAAEGGTAGSALTREGRPPRVRVTRSPVIVAPTVRSRRCRSWGARPARPERSPASSWSRALDRLQADGAVVAVPRRGAAPGARPVRPGTRPPAPAPPVRRATGNRLAEAAGYAGAVLVGAAGAVLVGQQWETPRPSGPGGRAGRASRSSSPPSASRRPRPARRAPPSCGSREHAVRRRLASTALTIAAATAAGTVGNLATEPHFAARRRHGRAGRSPPPSGWRRARSARSRRCGGRPAARRAVLDEAKARRRPSSSSRWPSWASRGRRSPGRRCSPSRRSGSRSASAVALYAGGVGAFYGTQPEEAIGIAVLALLAAGGLAGYVRTGRWPLAAAAALALAALVFRLTSDSLGAPVALLLTGLVLLGIGAVLLVRRRSGGAPGQS